MVLKALIILTQQSVGKPNSTTAVSASVSAHTSDEAPLRLEISSYFDSPILGKIFGSVIMALATIWHKYPRCYLKLNLVLARSSPLLLVLSHSRLWDGKRRHPIIHDFS